VQNVVGAVFLFAVELVDDVLPSELHPDPIWMQEAELHDLPVGAELADEGIAEDVATS
jgi:hypothetical protein